MTPTSGKGATLEKAVAILGIGMTKAKEEAGLRDPYRKTIGAQLQHAARLHRALIARKLVSVGLYPGQEQVLKMLLDAGSMTMGELAGALRVRPPTASKTVARLTTQGLIEKREGGRDGRLVRVGLTDAGRAKAAVLDDIWYAAEDELIAELDPKDRKRLRKALKRIGTALGADGVEPDDEDDVEAGE